VGERVGSFIGARVESGATARAERSGALPQLDSLWASLKTQFDAVLGGCEAV
jgi:hypothetical protein